MLCNTAKNCKSGNHYFYNSKRRIVDDENLDDEDQKDKKDEEEKDKDKPTVGVLSPAKASCSSSYNGLLC